MQDGQCLRYCFFFLHLIFPHSSLRQGTEKKTHAIKQPPAPLSAPVSHSSQDSAGARVERKAKLVADGAAPEPASQVWVMERILACVELCLNDSFGDWQDPVPDRRATRCQGRPNAPPKTFLHLPEHIHAYSRCSRQAQVQPPLKYHVLLHFI